MEEKEIEIIENIIPIFRQFGIKNITMDDIAQRLGMSKKTLYKYFANKNDLVQNVIGLRTEQIRKQIKEQISEAENAIDEIIRISSVVQNYLKNISPAFQFEMKKYYKPANDKFQKFHQEFVRNAIKKNLKQGIKEGLYRKNIDEEIIATFFLTVIRKISSLSHEQNEDYNIATAHIEMIRYHIRGVANEKGIEYLMKRVKNDDIQF